MITARIIGKQRGVSPARLLLTVLHSERARPLRFCMTGGLTALLQLGTLAFLMSRGVMPVPANACAILLAVETNFVLSRRFTWRGRAVKRGLLQTWAMFHMSVGSTAALNMLFFAVVSTVIPVFVASAAGIAVAALGNFALGDRLVFAGAAEAAT